MPIKTLPNKLSIIEKCLTLDGSVSFRGELIVEGTIKGRLEGDHVTVAEAGQIRAETHVADMKISGVFNGKLTVKNKLTLRSGGKCSGTIICRDLEMEAGSILDGDIRFNQAG